MSQRQRSHPYRRSGSIVGGIGLLLIVASLVQLLFGVPVSEGIAPAGLSLGPILLIGGIVLFFYQKPMQGDRWRDEHYPRF